MTTLGGSVHRFRLRGVNAYLVEDGDELVLIDAGTPWDRDRIFRGLAVAGVDPSNIDSVLLTHYDPDHVGTLGALGLRDSVRIHAAEPDASYVTGDAKPSFGTRKGAFHRLVGPFLRRPTNPVEPIDDGDEIGGFVAYRTPGHTAGHTAFVHEGLGVAFVGDMVRESGGKLVPSPWLLTADTDANRASIRDFAERCPPVDVVAMGHGTPIEEHGLGALKRVADRV
ncbi:metallo-beta-lactamase superfamily protein [Haloferax larsenii JCM 13917]|nr:MBL fold metallo-hydrolase [Haloferax larsenii]ELZ84314.1 metallo-beta-lactamase superfamily protein [Haloferax larsenii JCM 13917]